jgi:hypothetical protein
MTDKQKYYHLLAEVIEDLPFYAPTQAIRAGYGDQYPSAATRLAHVKQGKVACLPDLIAMVEITMPDFEIPPHLRPAA